MISPELLAVTSLKISWPWYIVRASGIIAIILTLLLMLSGIGMVTGMTYRFFEPLKAWTLHKAIATALSFCVLAHVGFLLIDKFAPYNLANVLVPFSVHYEHSHVFGLSLGSFYNALGIIAAYLLIIIVLSSLYFIDSQKKLWKYLHYLSYPFMLLVFLHTLFLGTDFKHGILRYIWIAFGVLLIIGLIARLRRAWTINS